MFSISALNTSPMHDITLISKLLYDSIIKYSFYMNYVYCTKGNNSSKSTHGALSKNSLLKKFYTVSALDYKCIDSLTVAVGIPESSEATRKPFASFVTLVSGTFSVSSYVAAWVALHRRMTAETGVYKHSTMDTTYYTIFGK